MTQAVMNSLMLESISPNNETSSELALWYVENNISRIALRKLFVVLRKYGKFLTNGASTLLKTPSNISALKKCKGDFIYLGNEAGLLNLLSQNIELRSLSCLELIANIFKPQVHSFGQYYLT